MYTYAYSNLHQLKSESQGSNLMRSFVLLHYTTDVF